MKTENQPQPLPDNAESASLDDFKEYLDNSKKLSKEPLDSELQIETKVTALRFARDLNPNKTSDVNEQSLSASYTKNITAPSVAKVLQDAQTIYDWLTA